MAHSLTICYFTEKKIGKKIKRNIYKADYFDSLTFDNAKYIAATNGETRGLRFINEKRELVLEKEAKSFIGYQRCKGSKSGSIAFVSKMKKTNTIDAINAISDISIHAGNFKRHSLSNDMVRFEMIEDLLSEDSINFFDYSIEANNIWGPMENIPKGYTHIKSGIVEKGDYVWYKDNSFLKVDVSFSPAKTGTVIELTGCLYEGKHAGKSDNESIKYYNHFIIRKTP